MKKHIQDFNRFSVNENFDDYNPNPEGLEYLEQALRALTPCQLGALIINSGNTQHDYVIDHFVDGLGGMGLFDDVRSPREAKNILIGMTRG